MSDFLTEQINRKSQKGFVKNGIAFIILLAIIAVLFWITHLAMLPPSVIFLIYSLLLLGATYFALRFLIFPFLFPGEEGMIENSQLFKSEESLKDFRLKGTHGNVGNMISKFSGIITSFKSFYYGGLFSNSKVETQISEDIFNVPSGNADHEFEDINTKSTDLADPESEDILSEFSQVSQNFLEEKELLKVDRSTLAEDKKEIEESIKFQSEYIHSVKEEKEEIKRFLTEQKEDLADLLVQKEKEEIELAALTAIEKKVTKSLNSERGDLKKILSASKRELAAINVKRRQTMFDIRRNRNEASRKTDLIKQVQQRRMALASIKKEKLAALNS